MKSLILKDLYNIGHNVKSMLFVLVILAIAFFPTSGVVGYTVMCAVLCSMWIITTFSFDDISKWTRYAMVMPISRKELVGAKFIVLAVFGAVGSLIGTAGSLIGELLRGAHTLTPAGIREQLFLTLIAWEISLIFGALSIPLVFKFGVEKSRLLLFVTYLVPSAICFGIYRLLLLLGDELASRLLSVLLYCSPVIALLWCYGMYRISYRIFARREL
ncbi:MAG: ABC-2 transporter permease [bacterium]|nr:ABC-2 transporter permease [bacterium]